MTTLTPAVGRAFYGGFTTLKPAQADAIAPVLAGQDVLVLSPTGSGKTEAVVAPLVDRYLGAARAASGCAIIYITPTRALANDLHRRLQGPIEALGLGVGVRHGERDDVRRTKRPELLITTPESLDVMLTAGETALMDVRAVVLDEVHLIYNTQRGFQLAVLLQRLEDRLGRKVQVAGLSATVAAPDDIWAFFRSGGGGCAVVRDLHAKPIDCHLVEAPTQGDVAHLVDRLGRGRTTKALLFANSRRECDRLGSALRGQTAFGDEVYVHHSSLGREERLRTEQRFQKSPHALCVATSTLELGIDIGDIDVVLLYGHPGGWEAFLQRVGRGNRRGEKTNVVCLPQAQLGSRFADILAFDALLGQIEAGRIERERPLQTYGAAAQQILSLVAERDGAYRPISEFVDLFSGWPHLSRVTVEKLVASLVMGRYLQSHGFQNRVGSGPELHRLQDLRLIWGNFPARSHDVRLMSNGREVGSIPATNLLRIAPGTALRFGGRYWHVRRMAGYQIEVQPCSPREAIDVSYGGTRAPLDPALVEEMRRVLVTGEVHLTMPRELNEWFARRIRGLRQAVDWERSLPIARDHRGYHILTFAGGLMNTVLARWFRLDVYDAGEIALRTNQMPDLQRLPNDISELQEIASQALVVPDDLTMFQAMLPVELLQRELTDLWVRTPVFERSLQHLTSVCTRATEMPADIVADLFV